MGRTTPGTYATTWQAPEYTVDESGKVTGGTYRPTGPHNWGRWGEDDQRGTQNLIGEEQRAAAARLVQTGRSFSLALPIDASGPRWPTRPAPLRWSLMAGSDLVTGTPYAEQMPDFQWNDDMFQMPTQGSTQWDALAHVVVEDTMYNGFWAGDVTAFGGARRLGIDSQKESFVGRGVLLDLARHQGLDSCPEGQLIKEDLLAECARAQGVTLQQGDIVLVRTGHLAGWWELTNNEAQMAYFVASPGLSASVVGWLHENDVSALATDTIAVERMVPENEGDRVFPLHVACLVDLGLPLGEFWSLDELAADCAEDGRYEFMLVAPPLNIPNALGSPLNPIALK